MISKNQIIASCILSGCILFSTSSPVFAIGATPLTAATSNASHVGTAAGLSAAGVAFAATTQAKSWYGAVGGFLGGLILTAGSVGISLVDPPEATYLSGSFDLIYPSDLFTPIFSGWLGDWGVNPDLAPPPVNPLDWGDGIQFFIQPPAAGLSSFIDTTTPGIVSVSFDWGTNGTQASTSDNFNFFATAFEVERDVRATYLGEHSTPPAGANNYIANTQILCIPPEEDEPSFCGSETTGYYRITPIPLPPTAFLILGPVLFFACRRVLQRFSHFAVTYRPLIALR